MENKRFNICPNKDCWGGGRDRPSTYLSVWIEFTNSDEYTAHDTEGKIILGGFEILLSLLSSIFVIKYNFMRIIF